MRLVCTVIRTGLPGRLMHLARRSARSARPSLRWYLAAPVLLVAVSVLSGSQSWMTTAAFNDRMAAVNTGENESYYYDALWTPKVADAEFVAPVIEEPVPGSVPAPAEAPFGVSSPVQLTASGIPAPAYRAYVQAASELARIDPVCGLHWSVVAGIGRVESNHGRFGGSTIGMDGVVRPSILGIRLDGSRRGTARISDSDGGRYDGDRQFDRAVGPMQFLPGTWKMYGGGRNPQDMNAAALATARYLCAGDLDLRAQRGRWAAVYRYNHSDSYVSLVLSLADSYASGKVVTFPSRPGDTPTTGGGESATPPGTPPSVPAPPTPRPTPTGTPRTSPPVATGTGAPPTGGTQPPGTSTRPTTTTEPPAEPPTGTTQPPDTATTTTGSPAPTSEPTPAEPTTDAPTASPTGDPSP